MLPNISRTLPSVPQNLLAAVVIPAYNEPDLATTLASLQKAVIPHNGVIEVFVVVNHAANSSSAVQAQNQKTLDEIVQWERATANQPLRVYAVDAQNLPEKYAGVGSARKIGMDLAAPRLLATSRMPGFILNLDADCTVSADYFLACHDFFANEQHLGASLYFEHPLTGDDAHDAAIIEYELFLRYYIGGLRWAGHPYAFQTVGSAMAVRANVYLQEGGMNRRKAAEDFYFLQKIIARGGFGDIVSTCVFPAARPSDRVPFGTGRSILDWQRKSKAFFAAYHPRSFRELRMLLAMLPDLHSAPQRALAVLASQAPAIYQFFCLHNAIDKLEEIKNNTSNFSTFVARFFRWFNLLQCRQFMHFARDRFYSSLPVQLAVPQLLNIDPSLTARQQLLVLRQLDRIRPSLPLV